MRLLGAILAGGASSRFGSDKAVASLNGRPLILHAAEQLEGRVADIVICGRTVAGFETLADRPAADLGPLGGLCAALHHAAANGYTAVLTIGCDTPVVPGAVWPALLAHGHGAVIDDMPIIGHWPAALSGDLDRHLATPASRSIGRWADRCGLARIAAPGIANINVVDDLMALQAAHDDPASA